MNQIDFNNAIAIIESNTVYKLSAATDEGAFLIPVQNDTPMGQPFHLTFKKIQGLADIAASKPKR